MHDRLGVLVKTNKPTNKKEHKKDQHSSLIWTIYKSVFFFSVLGHHEHRY